MTSHRVLGRLDRARYIFVLAAVAGMNSFLACTGETNSESAVMQHGFSWVLEGQLAGMPRPGLGTRLEDDLAFLTGQGIDLLVSLTIETPDTSLLSKSGIDSLHLPIPDFHPPSLEQQIEFVERASTQIRSGGRVAVHCTAGMGRSGTMLATYFVFTGKKPREAIAEVRKLRPGSIETAAQEASIRAYWQYLQQD